MKNQSIAFILVSVLLALVGCKKELTVTVLQDSYMPTVKQAETTSEEFIVRLSARALQLGEKGQWKLIGAQTVKDFVFIEDPANPFSRFKGMPGEKYTLEWTRWAKDGSASSVQSVIEIPQLNIVITDQTPTEFQTIRTLSVNPKYRGKWTITPAHGQLDSRYFDGYAEPPEQKPSIELHGYANTTYTATYNYNYGGRAFQFQKTFTTGNYTQDEALMVLQLDRGNYRVVEDNNKNVLELNLQASGIAWVFDQPNLYPSLRALKHMRKLILGGSSLGKIPQLFGEEYHNLEELNMDRMGSIPVFPENFGNLSKLKTLIFVPLYYVNGTNTITLPKTFAGLQSLESLTITSAGMVDFNGTLGSLTKLRELKTSLSYMPEEFGNLKVLEHLEIYCKSEVFPQSFSQCQNLIFARMTFENTGSGTLVLPSQIGNLKKLETFELTSQKLQQLPATFTQMTALKKLILNTNNLQSIPTNIGSLSNLESIILFAKATSIPESLGSLGKLSELHLVTKAETLPESFGNLSSLVYFNAESSSLKKLSANFGNLKKLREIALRFSQMQELPDSFGGLDALEKLNLSDTKMQSFSSTLIDLKSITLIGLNNTNAGDIPDEISRMKPQVQLYLINIPSLKQDRIKQIVSITKGKAFFTSYGNFFN